MEMVYCSITHDNRLRFGCNIARPDRVFARLVLLLPLLVPKLLTACALFTAATVPGFVSGLGRG